MRDRFFVVRVVVRQEATLLHCSKSPTPSDEPMDRSAASRVPPKLRLPRRSADSRPRTRQPSPHFLATSPPSPAPSLRPRSADSSHKTRNQPHLRPRPPRPARPPDSSSPNLYPSHKT